MGWTPAVAETGPEVVPPGTTVLLPDAGWCWFEGARATFGGGGATLYASGVGSAKGAAPGVVLLTEVDLATGSRRLVPLGQTHVDDHNSAAILEADTGEVLTAWTAHNRTAEINPQRRRTDGSWLLLPPVPVPAKATYSNLYRAPTGEGTPDLVYDFYRGERSDPSVLVSTDVGRTWTALGRLLQDPEDLDWGRPYVVYASLGDGRIHLLATEAHPRDRQTSLYHGYIEDGLLHRSDGTVVTQLGTPAPVTSLTRVWAPSDLERGWSADIVVDPATREPVVAFSVRHSITDHRYWHARLSDGTWTAREVAFAGDALFAREEDYTGLIALDPRDPDRMVISTDVDPDDGEPLTSASDGQVHWELFEGALHGNDVTWTPLTQHSRADNLRPVFAAAPDGASALLWMRGDYPSFTTYDTDIVGFVRGPGGAPVVPAPMGTVLPLRVLPDPGPQPTAARPIVGRYDGHLADDVLLYRPGTGLEQLWLGDEQGRPTPVAARQVAGTYTPVAGDYDGDRDTDIYWYSPGSGREHLWLTDQTRFTDASARAVNGTYTPIPGDYDGDGDTDIYWYAAAAGDSLWLADGGTFTNAPTPNVTATYTPIPGDHDGDGDTDIYWYAPGSAPEALWLAEGGTFTNLPTRNVAGTYTPIPGDLDGDGDTDILWYAPGSVGESLWLAGGGTFTNAPTRNVAGTYTPIPGDHDGDGDTDIHWYAPGSATDHVWWWSPEGTSTSRVAPMNL